MSEAVETVETNEEEFEAQLPTPVGYRVLVAMPKVEEAFEGSELLKSVTTKHRRNYDTEWLQVETIR